MYPVVVGNSLYVYKKTGETIAILDAATGNVKDTIPITKWSAGLCLIVGMDDKVFVPGR